MYFTCRPFIGASSHHVYSQYWENEPEDPALKSSRGHLFALMAIEVDTGEVAKIGHQFIDYVNQLYFSSPDIPISLHLSTVFAEVSTSSPFNLSHVFLQIVIVFGDQVFLISSIDGQAILYRQPQISLLLPQSSSIKLVSGKLLDNDRLFLSTPKFFQTLGLPKIKTILPLANLSEVEENFAAALYEIEDQNLCSGVVVEVHSDEENISTPANENISPSVITPTFPQSSTFSHQHSRSSVFISNHDLSAVTRRKKIYLWLSLVILIGLSISIYFGYRHNQEKKIESQYQQLKTEFQNKFSAAQSVKSLNLEEAKNIGLESQKILTSLESLSVHSDEVKEFKSSLDTLLSETGSREIEYQKFYDTSLIHSSPKYDKLVGANSSLYLLDSTQGRVDSVDIKGHSFRSLSQDSNLISAASLAVNNDQIYFLKDKSIYHLSKGEAKSVINLSEDIKNFSEGQFSFWNGSIYLLDTTSGQKAVWKFSPNSSDFSAGTLWLKDKQSLSPQTVSLAINGQIWTLTSDGKIAAYLLGTRQNFQQVDQNKFSQAANLITTIDSDILAFTEQSKYIYVYSKSGSSPKMFNYQDKTILSIAPDPSGKTIYILCSDQIIYKIDL